MARAVNPAAKENFDFQKIIAAVGAVLMIGKFLAYFLTNSVSILTDALESIVNVVAGVIGLYALWLSMRPADSSHPYGHGKVELISSSVEGSLICVAGVMIILESADRFMNPQDIGSLDVGIVIVAVAAAANFAMGYTAIRKGRKNSSIALESSGRHLCTDTYDSVGIIIGLLAVYIGDAMGYDVWWLDPLVAVCFGVFIGITGLRVLYKSMNGIMDRADEDILRDATRCINHARTPEVIDVHHLRVIRYGMEVHVDMHITFPEWITVKRADEVIDGIRREVCKQFGEIVDLTAMADPCKGIYCRRCPMKCQQRRQEFVNRKVLSISVVTKGDTKHKVSDEPREDEDRFQQSQHLFQRPRYAGTCWVSVPSQRTSPRRSGRPASPSGTTGCPTPTR